jgi:hypothetical protein
MLPDELRGVPLGGQATRYDKLMANLIYLAFVQLGSIPLS